MANYIKKQTVAGSSLSGDPVDSYLARQKVLIQTQNKINGAQAGGGLNNKVKVPSFNGAGGKEMSKQSAVGNKLLIDLNQQAAYDNDLNQWGGRRKKSRAAKKRSRRRSKNSRKRATRRRTRSGKSRRRRRPSKRRKRGRRKKVKRSKRYRKR